MSDGRSMAGSFLTGTVGAWFVAAGELDVDPAWSLAKKILVIVVGGLLAGITHQLGTKLAAASVAAGARVVARLRGK